MGQYPICHNRRTEGFKKDCTLPSWEFASFCPGKFQFALSRLTACVEALMLHPGSDNQRALFFHSSGVIFYIYTTKNSSILANTAISLVSPWKTDFRVITASKVLIFNNKFLLSLRG